MLFGYGNWRAEAGEARPTSWTETITRSARQQIQSVTRTLGVEFEIIKDGQNAIQDRLAQIRAAIPGDGRDVGFYLDSGAKSGFFITQSETSSGVNVVQSVQPQPSDAADYATHLKATAAFQGVYTAAQIFGAAQLQVILDYGETVSMIGDGGPRYAILAVDTGPPHKYTLCDQTPVVVRQSGFLVQSVPGVNANPYVASDEFLDSESRELSPSVRWNSRSGQAEYALTWNFTFVLPSFSVFNPILR